jgi:uncharacterized protein
LDTPVDSTLDSKIEKAVTFITQFKGVVVALSAGVDSSLVAKLAQKALGDRAIAATAVSESLPPGELDIAKKTAAGIGIKHVIVRTNELQNPSYAANPADRCYYCKDTLYRELRGLAEDLRLEAIMDGTQVDDLDEDRPGRRAAREAGVRSPLLEAGFSKAEVREAAKTLGLSVWDKPAMPCLSSRIPHGQEVTLDKLSAVGEAEQFIKQLTGVRDLRVRHHGTLARIEVRPEDRHIFYDESLMDKIDSELRSIGFANVTLDLRGYRKPRASDTGEGVVLPVLNMT